MDTNDKLSQLENEIEVLKNEVQAVSLALRRNHLKARNQFNGGKPATAQQTILNNRIPISVPGLEEKLTVSISNKQSQRNAPESMGVLANIKSVPQTAHEEVERARQPVRDSHSTRPHGTHDSGRKIDMVNIAELARWVEESTRQLGRERTEAVIDISEIMGYLPLGIKQILDKVTHVKPGDNVANIVALDYLDSLVKVRERRREILNSLLSVES